MVSPVVPDFTNITANCVEATYGITDNPFENQGVVTSRHQVVTRQGTDPYTGGLLAFLPSGENRVVKLGNSQVGSEAESVTYHFIVDPDKAVLLLKFAVVFQDPSHDRDHQPRFIVRIMNKEGELIDACAEYDVSARAEIEGFHTYDKWGVPIRWRDWTNVGLDMSMYAGQEVQVQFVTYDCALSGHFGYAYFTANCVSHQLAFENCKDDEFTVSAPKGFASYLWQDGREEYTTVWTKGSEDMNITCAVTSATGCRFTLSAFVSTDNELPATPEIYDTICQGDTYVKYNYNLPPQEEIGTFLCSNAYFDARNCTASGTTLLFLTVLQRYYPIVEELCPGESYVDHGFSYEKPAPGIYFDTLSYARGDGKCDSVVTLRLTVLPELIMSGNIMGEAQPCVGSLQTYSIAENWEDHTYSWEFPDGFFVLSGQGTSEVVVQVTDVAEVGTVSLIAGTRGCAFGSIPFVVEPRPAYWQTLNDSICTGSEYHENGFDVSRQDTVGIYTYTQYHQTKSGCDSIVTLNLYVFKTPEVRIAVQSDVICAGERVKLEALGEGAGSFPDTAYLAVAIGDILCMDGTIVKPLRLASSGKTARGVVFYVNKNGRNGWAVDLRNRSEACRWGYYLQEVDIPGLPNYVTNETAALDTMGYDNTKTIRAAGSQAIYEAAYLVDFARGWYIPATAQLLQLYAYIIEVNASLVIAGGSPFVFNTEEWYYWSSSEYTNEKVWALSFDGLIGVAFKHPVGGGKLRAVCSF